MQTSTQPIQTAAASVVCPDCRAPLTATWSCTGCGAAYPTTDGIPRLIGASSELNLSEVATQDEVSKGYDNIRYKKSWSRQYHEHTLAGLVRLQPARGDVLDDGCGPGLVMEYLREHASEMTSYTGIDVSQGMLSAAARRRTRGNEHLYQADACRLPFADGSFDTVYVRGLLHHLPDPEAGVAEVARVLRPGGSALMLEPNKTVISALPRLLARRSKHFDKDHKNFSARTVEKLVSSALELDKVEFFGYLAYPVLGYPDVLNFEKFLPMDAVASSLSRFDDELARLPGVRRLGWGIIVTGKKR